MLVIWGLVSVLFVLWLVDTLAHVGGTAINLILVAAVLLLAVNLLSGRGARA
jgi:Family of unknown function (DUF5670)